ncbi:hypothetical protein AB6D12_10375 [Vibrio cyclitrophicus]
MRINVCKINDIAISLLVFSSIVFTRSFGVLKLPLLILCLLLSFYLMVKRKHKFHLQPLVVIITVMFGSVIWSIIGLYSGNSDVAVLESLRLFVVYYIINMVIILYLYERLNYLYMDIVFSLSTISIFLFSIMAIFDISLIPTWLLKEINLNIGLHDGYIQNTAHHIGMLALTVPYLIVVSVYNVSKIPKTVSISAVLGLICIVLSSRRAIYVIVACLPFFLVFFHYVTHVKTRKKSANLARFIAVYVFVFLFSILMFYMYYPDKAIVFYERITDAISQFTDKNIASERGLQAFFLLSGFKDAPLIGSGFGGTVDFVRNSERPWIFELSYHSLLFNVGLIGFTIFLLSFLYSFLLIIERIKRTQKENKYHVISVLVAVLSMLIVSFSNPYISSSYDFLLVNFLIPLVTLKELSSIEKV